MTGKHLKRASIALITLTFAVAAVLGTPPAAAWDCSSNPEHCTQYLPIDVGGIGIQGSARLSMEAKTTTATLVLVTSLHGEFVITVSVNSSDPSAVFNVTAQVNESSGVTFGNAAPSTMTISPGSPLVVSYPVDLTTAPGTIAIPWGFTANGTSAFTTFTAQKQNVPDDLLSLIAQYPLEFTGVAVSAGGLWALLVWVKKKLGL